MIKSRTAQLIYQSIYIGIAIIALLASFGLFLMDFRWDFYIHFTNLSNYLCMIVMLIELRDTAIKKEDSYVDTLPTLKFVSLLSILLTFIIYNFVLATTRDAKDSFLVSSVTLHIILPIMFTFDYILFYERGKVKWYYPLLSAVFPILYVIFVFVHAAVLKFDTSIISYDKRGPFIYPYFFLRLDKLGAVGVFKNCVAVAIGFVIFGYLIMFIDKLVKKLSK